MLAVYACGYVRTRAAAERFAEQTEARVPAFALRAPAGKPVIGRHTNEPAMAPPADEPAVAPRAPVDTPAEAVEITASTPAREGKRRRASVVLVAPATRAHGTPAPATPAPATPAPAAAEAPVSTASASAQNAPADKPAAPQVPAAPAAPAAPTYKDGTYLGWGTSRHGDIQAQVVIEDGRIASATIAQCLTRYSCSVIGKLPPQVAERQSPEVDYVSGATQSTNAFYYAVVEALSKAK